MHQSSRNTIRKILRRIKFPYPGKIIYRFDALLTVAEHLIFSTLIIFLQVVVQKRISSKKVFHSLSLENCFCYGFYSHNSHCHNSHLIRLISDINIILYPWKSPFTKLLKVLIVTWDNYYDRKDWFLLLVVS